MLGCLRWPRLFSRWRAAGQRKWRRGLIGGVLAIDAGCVLAWVLRAFFRVTDERPSGRRRLRGAGQLDVTLEIPGWVVVVAGHLGLKGAVLKAVRCRVPRRPRLNSCAAAPELSLSWVKTVSFHARWPHCCRTQLLGCSAADGSTPSSRPRARGSASWRNSISLDRVC
jgi:hypothetical protein